MYARVQFKLALPYRLKCTLYFRRYANEDHQRVRTLSCINTILIPATAAGSHENVPSPFSRSPLHRFLHIRSLVSRVSICGSDRLLVSESHLLVATRTTHVSNILFHLYIFSSVFSFLPRSHPFSLSLFLSLSLGSFSSAFIFSFLLYEFFLLACFHASYSMLDTLSAPSPSLSLFPPSPPPCPLLRSSYSSISHGISLLCIISIAAGRPEVHISYRMLVVSSSYTY